jgi:hypothetical protein
VALNLSDRIAVRKVILDRCTSAVVKLALYWLGGGGNPTAGQTAWAKETMRNPAEVGERASWHVLDQNDFINTGSSISDDVLAGAIETAIRNRFVTEPS